MVSPVKSWRKVSQAPIKFTTCHAGCGVQVEYRTTPRVRCAACKAERTRQDAEKQRRKKGIERVKGKVIACLNCGVDVILNRNPDTKYCAPCGLEKTRERSRQVSLERTGVPGSRKYHNEAQPEPISSEALRPRQGGSMTMITMKAVDTIHVSAAGPDNIPPGGKFDVPESIAKNLEDRGLATRVGAAKAEKPPENKMEAAPANKAISAASVSKKK